MTIVLLLHPSFPLWPGTVFTEFSLMCDDHARLFTENFTLSHSTSLCFEPSSLKFLRSLNISVHVNEQIVRCFSTIIRDFKNFERIGMRVLNESAFECLEQIPNPLTCRLKLEITFRLKSSETLKLSLELDNFCFAEAENKLVSRITHKTLVQLDLWNMSRIDSSNSRSSWSVTS